MDREFWNKYAKVVVDIGVNLQKGEILCIHADIAAKDLVRELVAEGYKAGAERVVVTWSDEQCRLLDLTLGEGRPQCNVADWEVAYYDYMADKKVCFARILSGDPELFSDVDPALLAKAFKERQTKFVRFEDGRSVNQIKWCLFAYPDVAWAKKVRPDLDEQGAVDYLCNLISHAMRLDLPLPVQAWQTNNELLHRRARLLNEFHLAKLHYTNSLGTDLWVQLPQNYIFAGGSEPSDVGVDFNPNMPTEEIFGAPYKYGVDGVIVASMPLFYNGARVEDFGLRLSKGRIVDYWAKVGKEVLDGIIDCDEGSHYLGEVALVPYDSPIQNLGVLFLETLFDENASCHFAIGDAYPSCVEGGLAMSKEQLEQAGINVSDQHVDFMVGTKDLCIMGYDHAGKEIPIFVDGNFAF